MKDRTAFPLGICLILVLLTLTFCSGCATATWQAQLAPDSLASQTISAVATKYGGKDAGALASAGLSATADVLQGYVDKKPPLDIVVESPGVEGVGHVLVNYLTAKGLVTQATVDQIHKAAAFAARVTYSGEHIYPGPRMTIGK